MHVGAVAINGVDAIEEKKIFVVSCKNAHTQLTCKRAKQNYHNAMHCVK